MPPAADDRFLVLHALRLKGLADVETLALTTGLASDGVQAALAKLDVDGQVIERSGRMPGWALSGTGRAAHAELLAAQMASVSDRALQSVRQAYERFLDVNRQLLAVCTAWQMREVGGQAVLNDHRDEAYDRSVIDRLGVIDDIIQPIAADLGAALPRLAPYGPRLHRARQLIEGGQFDWFTKPVIDSYHTVWFELHEDLLATLGIERSKEEV